jgi:hypothetical protein
LFAVRAILFHVAREPGTVDETLVSGRSCDHLVGGAGVSISVRSDLFAPHRTGLGASGTRLLQAYAADLRGGEQAFFRGLLRSEDGREQSPGDRPEAILFRR